MIKFIIGFGVVALVTYACCKAAKDLDDMEPTKKEKLHGCCGNGGDCRCKRDK